MNLQTIMEKLVYYIYNTHIVLRIYATLDKKKPIYHENGNEDHDPPSEAYLFVLIMDMRNNSQYFSQLAFVSKNHVHVQPFPLIFPQKIWYTCKGNRVFWGFFFRLLFLNNGFKMYGPLVGLLNMVGQLK